MVYSILPLPGVALRFNWRPFCPGWNSRLNAVVAVSGLCMYAVLCVLLFTIIDHEVLPPSRPPVNCFSQRQTAPY